MKARGRSAAYRWRLWHTRQTGPACMRQTIMQRLMELPC